MVGWMTDTLDQQKRSAFDSDSDDEKLIPKPTVMDDERKRSILNDRLGIQPQIQTQPLPTERVYEPFAPPPQPTKIMQLFVYVHSAKEVMC